MEDIRQTTPALPTCRTTWQAFLHDAQAAVERGSGVPAELQGLADSAVRASVSGGLDLAEVFPLPLARMAAARQAARIAPLLAVAAAFGLLPTGASGELMRIMPTPGGRLKVLVWIHPSPLCVSLGSSLGATVSHRREVKASLGTPLAAALREALAGVLGPLAEGH